MTKRKPLADDEDAIDEAALFGSGGDGLEKVTIANRNFWSDVDPLTARWLVACEAVDKRGDIQPLLEQLQACVPAEALPYVQDLLKRLTVKGKRGRRPTPLYERSRTNILLWIAVEEVRQLQKAGRELEDAVKIISEKVAKTSPDKIAPSTLKDACTGKRKIVRELLRRI
jgi:hypothetical protein